MDETYKLNACDLDKLTINLFKDDGCATAHTDYDTAYGPYFTTAGTQPDNMNFYFNLFCEKKQVTVKQYLGSDKEYANEAYPYGECKEVWSEDGVYVKFGCDKFACK